MHHLILLGLALFTTASLAAPKTTGEARPNVVLVMADDQGWGQTSYNGHPHLKTPNLDAMASAGLRLDRFYAAGPVCSPTRASVLTGRSPVRTGVPTHGRNLCLQEKTLPQALQKAGYKTGHFGKWHLNGIRGPGVPVLGDDANHPGHYGFDEWLTVTNFFDLDPLMSRGGTFEEFQGDSSAVTVDQALEFMARQKAADTPFLAVIWYGSPHSPMRPLEKDKAGLPEGALGDHLGEVVGIDRSIGTLRQGLRDLGIEGDTLVWYCSDNGGLNVDPDSCGHLRGNKGNLLEGGIRVPGIVEWPGHIRPATSSFPCSTMDIMPTLIDLLGLPEGSMLDVHDGESILPLLKGETPEATHPIPFLAFAQAALIDGDYKVFKSGRKKDGGWKLYDLKNDPGEKEDLSGKHPGRFTKMTSQAEAAIASIEASAEGKDYPEGRVLQPMRSEFWDKMDAYRPHLERFSKRPEYEKKASSALGR